GLVGQVTQFGRHFQFWFDHGCVPPLSGGQLITFVTPRLLPCPHLSLLRLTSQARPSLARHGLAPESRTLGASAPFFFRGLFCPAFPERRDSLVHRRHELGWKDNRRVLLDRDFSHGLQGAELKRDRVLCDDIRGFAELDRRLILAFGRNDLGAALALG